MNLSSVLFWSVGKSVGNKKNIITDGFTDGKGAQKNKIIRFIPSVFPPEKYRM
jgi:hypothetical protein